MKHFLALLSMSAILISCDKDFDSIGVDLVNETNFTINVNETTTITTENFRLDGAYPVQTDNLPYNILGYYNDPVYGNTTANILTQVELSEYGKDFGTNPVITKVIFSMPYYSNIISVKETGGNDYKLDSIYGNAPMQLSLYKSDYFLNDFDPSTNFEERQKYYSNEDAIFAPHSSNNPANLIFTETNFNVSEFQIVNVYLDANGNSQTEYLSPRLRKTLLNTGGSAPTTLFNWLIDPANEIALSSKSEFQNYFRGFYLKAENISGNGTLLGLDVSQVKIEVEYQYDDPNGGITPLKDTIEIQFNGSSVNTFINNFSYTEETNKIYLKSGEGSIVKIDLFNPISDSDRTSTELSDIQDLAENWLLNEAHIEFYVDDSSMNGGEEEPERIFLYDIENNRILTDYLADATNSISPLFSKINHLGRLERDDSGKGIKYKINITEHINNIIKKDSTNVKLGLVISNNVNLLTSSSLKNSTNPSDVLSSSVISHKGTILYNENAMGPKKLKLKIHYTKTN